MTDGIQAVMQALMAQQQPEAMPMGSEMGGIAAVPMQPMMEPPMIMAGNNELENLRRIIAKDKGGGGFVKPIAPPQSPQQVLEDLRRLIRENS